MPSKKGNENSNGHTLAIDREAYARLEEARKEHESFSEVIKRCVKPRWTAAEVLNVMRRADVSKKTLEAIDVSAARRRRTVYRTKE